VSSLIISIAFSPDSKSGAVTKILPVGSISILDSVSSIIF